MSYEEITVEASDGVQVITLNRPERLNAWTPTMSAEMVVAIEGADADDEIGAIVITGAGRGFCAGADIEAVFNAQLGGNDAVATPRRSRDWIDVVRSAKPIVAAVNGAAVGVGLTMILPADRIIASTASKFSVRFVKMGLVPELASSHFLPARVGWGVASDLMLSGRFLDGADAVETGLADELAEPDALLDTAIERAREYGENPAPSLRWVKELLSLNASEGDPTVVQAREMERLQLAYRTPEHKAAVEAFLSKTKSHR